MGINHKKSDQSEILKDVQILLVDNDLDSRYLYTILLQECGANVTIAGSIAQALILLYRLLPDIMISEINFKGESVDPLMQRLKNLAVDNGRPIPIIVTSTCPKASLVKSLKVGVEAYLLKPIYPDDLVFNVWSMVLLTKISYPLSIQECNTKQNRQKSSDELVE